MKLFLFLALSLFAQASDIINSNGAVKISWQPITEHSYNIYLGESSRKYPIKINVNGNSHTFVGLKNNVTYYTSIQSINKFGLTSSLSEEAVFVLKTVKEKHKYVKVLFSKDGGKTWVEAGEVQIPNPVVKGQKYKTRIVTK